MAAPKHFSAFAQAWANLTFPLRPNPETVKAFADLAHRHGCDSPTVAHILGLTPEFVTAEWLQNGQVFAIDHSSEMIDAVWSGDTTQRHVVQADWMEDWPNVPRSDVTLGDGVLTLYDYPLGVNALAAHVASYQNEGSLLLIRGFCQRAVTPTLQEVLDGALGQTIRNFHEFKLLLLNATQGADTLHGVVLHTVWQAFFKLFESVESCAAQTGWPVAEVNTIHLYQGSTKVYHMASVAEIAQSLQPHYTYLEHLEVPSSQHYATPVMAFRKATV